MHNPKLYIILFLLIFSLSSFQFSADSQDLFPESGFLYDDTEIPRIDITIDPGYLDVILQPGNEESDFEYPATFKMTRGTEVKTEENIGFRLRGNTSRYSAKKSFKVSMNTFTQGNTFHGVEKINLNGEHNDPSISRAKISWELFRAAGVPASRSNHVELYINGEYRGLYLNVEHIDEEFVDLRFDNNDGNLYKCLWPADLVYLGSNPELYKYDNNGRRAYELKRNEELDDYSDLANFIDILNNTNPSEFQEKLEPVFNVNSYLKNLVMEILTGHWDAYSYNKNNYYLYNNEETGKFEFIPYDPDNTFGIDWMGEDWAIRDIYNWSHPYEARPLSERLLQNDVYRDRYSFYMKRILDQYFNSEYLDPLLNETRDKIAPFTIDDLYRTLDYGYDYDDFYNSFESATGAHVKYGIKPYIQTRRQAAFAQLEIVNIAPIISTIQHNSPGINEQIIITALVEDEEVPQEVILHYSGGGGFSSIRMQATGNETYRAIIPGLSWEGTFYYYITATDLLSQTTREPFSGTLNLDILPVSAPEYLTSNTIEVYPNPATNWFIINAANPFNSLEYRVIDISGKQILSGKSMTNPVHVDIHEDMKDGLYILQVILKDWAGKIVRKEYSKIVLY
ncbi:MAG: CotH kinase family protein [Bacteroidales bacterium]